MFTYRRIFIDQFLNNQVRRLSGSILDIGGKKKNTRGEFSRPTGDEYNWIILNIDATVEPDILSDATAIPLDDQTMDCFLLCEVMEHLEDPNKVIAEANRVLKPGGTGIITVPFMYPIHADPNDFQRFTASKLKNIFENNGFSVTSCEAMGNSFSVIFDFLFWNFSKVRRTKKVWGKLLFGLLFALRKIAGKKAFRSNEENHSGYGLIVKKLEAND